MDPKISRVLLTTAFQPLSARAAPYASMMAREHDAELHVLHVAPFPITAVDPGAPMAAAMAATPPQEVLDDARAGVERFINEHLPEWTGRAVVAAVQGRAADEIVRYARERGIDLIVMGTRADGVLRRIVFGSVSKSVVEHSPCPVLLVPVAGSSRA